MPHRLPLSEPQLLLRAGQDPEAPPAELRMALERLAEEEPGLQASIDPSLLRSRALETATEGLSPIVGEIRRSRILEQDAISTTWIGWNVQSGAAEAIRLLRPAFRRDPVWIRRLARGTRLWSNLVGLAPFSWHPDPQEPHVRFRLPGIPLGRLFPVEDPADPVRLARLLGGSLRALAALHEQGLVHGAPTPFHILEGPRRTHLLWCDPVREHPGSPTDDLRLLAETLHEMDPTGETPVSQLLAAWEVEAPISAPDALCLFYEAMREHLVIRRHQVFLRSRLRHRQDRRSQLQEMVRRLSNALAPPSGRCCLRASTEGVLTLVESQHGVVRGGAANGIPRQVLPLIHETHQGIDALAARTLLRAWARRATGNTALRLEIQEQWGGSDELGASLTRWMAAQNRLRTLRLLLERTD